MMVANLRIDESGGGILRFLHCSRRDFASLKRLVPPWERDFVPDTREWLITASVLQRVLAALGRRGEVVIVEDRRTLKNP